MSKILEWLKAVIAAGGALANGIIVASADEAITFDEARGVVLLLVNLLTVAGVWAVRNRQAAQA